MKIITKNLILTLAVIMSSKAMASRFSKDLAGQNIECSAIDRPIHIFYLQLIQESDVDEQFGLATHYESLVQTFYGRSTGPQHEAIVTVNPINTRVIGGRSFEVFIPNFGHLVIKDIGYSFDESRFPIGFKGSFHSSSGKKIDLACSYFN